MGVLPVVLLARLGGGAANGWGLRKRARGSRAGAAGTAGAYDDDRDGWLFFSSSSLFWFWDMMTLKCVTRTCVHIDTPSLGTTFPALLEGVLLFFH